jgi:hypothetical protein
MNFALLHQLPVVHINVLFEIVIGFLCHNSPSHVGSILSSDTDRTKDLSQPAYSLLRTSPYARKGLPLTSLSIHDKTYIIAINTENVMSGQLILKKKNDKMNDSSFMTWFSAPSHGHRQAPLARRS